MEILSSEVAGSSRKVSSEDFKKLNVFRLFCVEQTGQGIEEGTWDAIHVVTTNVTGTQASYTAVSTVFVMINLNQ